MFTEVRRGDSLGMCVERGGDWLEQHVGPFSTILQGFLLLSGDEGRRARVCRLPAIQKLADLRHTGHSWQCRNKGECEFVMKEDLGSGSLKDIYQERT